MNSNNLVILIGSYKFTLNMFLPYIEYWFMYKKARKIRTIFTTCDPTDMSCNLDD